MLFQLWKKNKEIDGWIPNLESTVQYSTATLARNNCSIVFVKSL